MLGSLPAAGACSHGRLLWRRLPDVLLGRGVGRARAVRGDADGGRGDRHGRDDPAGAGRAHLRRRGAGGCPELGEWQLHGVAGGLACIGRRCSDGELDGAERRQRDGRR